MKKTINISPMITTKMFDEELEKNITISYIIVDNGPCLMTKGKKYTNIFNKLIEASPLIKTAIFYNKTYTNYKITILGQNSNTINKIKETLLKEYGKARKDE